MSYKTLLLIIVFLLIPIVFLLRLNQKPTTSLAEWWNDAWTYRQAITITISSSTADFTNLDTNISVGTSALIAGGKLQSDCDDLRFTDVSGKLLPYYLDSGCNTATTKIWIRANLVPKNTTSYVLYLYYGNPSASAASDATTFNLYNGLVGYWNFNENTGTSTVDLSVNSNAATFGTGNSAPGWTTGKYGVGVSLDGSSDYLSGSSITNLPTGQSARTISTWVKPSNVNPGGAIVTQNNSAATSQSYMIELGVYSGITYLFTDGINSNNNITVTGAQIPSVGSWHHLVFTFNGASTWIYYLDGVQQKTGSFATTINTNANTIDIGRRSDGGNTGYHFPGLIDDTRIYNRVLNSTEVTQLYNTSDSITTSNTVNSNPTTSFSSEETSPGPIAYWKFDEGVGTTAQDSSSNNNDGTITGATWQNEDMCVSGKCLKYDGSTAYISPTTVPLSGTTYAMEAWFKVNTPSTTQSIFAQRSSSNSNSIMGQLYVVGSKIAFITRDNSGGNSALATGTTTLLANTWYHAVGVRDGSNVYVYLNGRLEASDNDSGGTITTNVSDIGRYNIGGSPGGYFGGFIDDVRIYPYARTATQIKQDYATGLSGQSAAKGANANIGSASFGKSLSDGLVGYWKMDETATPSLDSSGNGSTGTWNGNTAAAAGKFGNGVTLDGTGDYVNMGAPTSLNIDVSQPWTIGTWFNKTGAGSGNWGYLFDLNKGAGVNRLAFGLDSTNTYMRFIATNNNIYTDTTALTNGQWYFISMTYDGKTIKRFINGTQVNSTDATLTNGSLSGVTIGKPWDTSDYYFYGLIDETRIYNRTLSPSEITTLYNYAPGPVGYWKMDEGVGTTAYDSSGNNNNGAFGAGGSAPTWTNGKYGKGLKFDGTNDYVTMGDITTFDGLTQMTISAWIYPRSLPSGTDINSLIAKADFSAASNNSYFIRLRGTEGVRAQFSDGTNVINCNTTDSPSLLTWTLVTAVLKSDDNCYVYFNGQQKANSSNSSFTTVNNSAIPLKLGASNSSSELYFNGSIDDVKIYNYARTQKQILEDMNGGRPANTSPLLFYKLDEGQGAVTNNSGTGGTLNGILGTGNSSPTWTTGKVGKGLSFDGNDSVDAGDVTGTDNIPYLSVSYWVKGSTTQAAYFGTVAKGVDAGASSSWYFWGSNGSSSLIWQVSNGSSAPQITISNVLDNNWHHLVGTYDGTNIAAYLDGRYVSSSPLTGNINNTAAGVQVGRYNSPGRFFTGLLDEVKIYSYPLTAAEVQADYNQGSSAVFGQSIQTIGATITSLDYCLPGDTSSCSVPVAEWKMDEGVGTTTTDSSGNNNTGTFGASTAAPTWTTSKIGKGIKFDGVNDYVDMGANVTKFAYTQPFTISAWLKATDITNYGGIFVQQASSTKFGYGLRVLSGNIDFYLGLDGVGSNLAQYAASTNQWYHVEGTFDGSSAMKLYINGRIGDTETYTYGAGSNPDQATTIGADSDDYTARSFEGQVDQVRIYNYARTPAQVAWDYNKGKPVAWYRFDECQGTTAYDASGNGNNGVITIGASGTNTSAGTCTGSTGQAWKDGATGKYSSSLEFDGTDDWVNIADSDNLDLTNNFTISLWMKPGSLTQSNKYLISKLITGSSTDNVYAMIWEYVDNSIEFYTGAYTGTNPRTGSQILLADTSWHHILYTYNGTTWAGYKDGVNIFSTARTFSVNTSTNSFVIGDFSTSADTIYNFDGQIDDVKIFNYALTATQIKTLYNGGAVNFR